jgi:hypothetical protein
MCVWWMEDATMPTEEDIRAYDERRDELARHYFGKFVIFHDGQLMGVFDDFEAAGENALRQFEDAPFLIRKAGDSDLKHISISVIRSQ